MAKTFEENTADIKNQEKYTLRVREILKSKGRTPKYYITTFGCQQNEADSERLSGTAKNLGYEKAESMEDADLIIQRAESNYNGVSRDALESVIMKILELN